MCAALRRGGAEGTMPKEEDVLSSSVICGGIWRINLRFVAAVGKLKAQ